MQAEMRFYHTTVLEMEASYMKLKVIISSCLWWGDFPCFAVSIISSSFPQQYIYFFCLVSGAEQIIGLLS